jgi:hypothetical protein
METCSQGSQVIELMRPNLERISWPKLLSFKLV